MDMKSMHRRDFLKMSATLPLIGLAWPQLESNGWSPESDAPNVLIIVYDSLSAKHLSLHNYARDTTPNLSRFAARANVYHRCYSAGNFTTPGTASLLTGTYPWSHRAVHMHGVPTEYYRSRNLFSLLSKRLHTVAYTHNLLVASLLHHFGGGVDLLKPTRDLCLYDDEYSDLLFKADYNHSFWAEWLALRGTGTPPSSLFLSLAHRALRFFHKSQARGSYADQFPRGIPSLHNQFFVLEHATDWMQDSIPSFPQPFLAYIHLLPPHEPYTARRDFVDLHRDGWTPEPKLERRFSHGVSQKQLNRQRRHYDEYLSYADSEFGRLLDALESSGILDDTYLIFTSDHGELFERGIRGHVTPTLYDPVVHVPLMISRPGQTQRQDFYSPVSAVDLVPTLLDVVGEEIPDWCEGQVLPGFRDAPVDPGRPIYAVEAKSNPKLSALSQRTIAVIQGDTKLIDYAGYGDLGRVQELYKLDADPDELIDLAPTAVSERGRLLDMLEAELDRAEAVGFR